MKGISYLHSNGIFHRDIKAEKILLDVNLQPKISGFKHSINNLKMNDDFTSSRSGTKHYMAPEILGIAHYKPATADIFAAGTLHLRWPQFQTPGTN